MTIYVPKSGRKFKEGRSLINHIRSVYASTEEAYLDIYSISDIPKCEYCKTNNKKFIGLRLGYKEHCGSRECKSKYLSFVSKNKDFNSEEYYKFVVERIDYYNHIYKSGNPYHDEFYNVSVKNPKKFITLKLGKFRPQETLYCIISDTEYTYDILKDTDRHKLYNISSKRTSYLSKYSYEDVKEFKQQFIETLSYSDNKKIFDSIVDLYSKCSSLAKELMKRLKIKLTLVESYIDGNTIIIDNNIISLYGSEHITGLANLTSRNLDYLYDYDYKHNCRICNSKYHKYDLFLNVKTNGFVVKQIGAEYTCSRQCYIDLLQDKNKYYEYSEESRRKQSEALKIKIQNNEFTPCVTNSRCKSRVYSNDGKAFRSTWEAVFYSLMVNKGFSIEYEKLRIKYLFNDNWFNYITDFIDEENKIIYEIKPKGEIDDKVRAKEKYALEWCNENDYEYKFVTEDWFNDNVTHESIDIILKMCKIEEKVLLRRMKQFLK